MGRRTDQSKGSSISPMALLTFFAGFHRVFLPSPFVHHGRQKSGPLFNQQSRLDSSRGQGCSWEEKLGNEERQGFANGETDSMASSSLIAGQRKKRLMPQIALSFTFQPNQVTQKSRKVRWWARIRFGLWIGLLILFPERTICNFVLNFWLDYWLDLGQFPWS